MGGIGTELANVVCLHSNDDDNPKKNNQITRCGKVLNPISQDHT